MKYDRFMLGIGLITAAITLIAVIAVFSTQANSKNTNASLTVGPTDVPTGTPVPTASDIAGLPGVSATPGPKPDRVNWFGSVTDSFGKPFAGINVTLHLMTPAGEASNLTTTTLAVGKEYPGSYVFENVPVSPDVTYAYATADVADLDDGVHYYGRSANYTSSTERISSGFIVLHVPMPDQLKVAVENATIAPINVAYVNQPTGLPNSTLVTGQLYLNGRPYKRSGVTIEFAVDNEAAVILSGNRIKDTDETGRASILLSGNNAGAVNVTGFTKIGIGRNLTDTGSVRVAV